MLECSQDTLKSTDTSSRLSRSVVHVWEVQSSRQAAKRLEGCRAATRFLDLHGHHCACTTACG